MQIRSRLSLSFIGITILLLLFSLVFIYLNFRNHLYSEFYNTLRSKALMTVTMVVKNNPDLTFAEDDLVSDEINLPAKENIIIYSLDYKKLFAFHLEPDIPTAQLSSIAKKGEEKFDPHQLYL